MLIAAHTNVTADVQVKTGPGQLVAVHLTGGSDAATLVLYDNTAGSGTVLATLKTSAANETDTWTPACPYSFSVGIYADITGTGPSATVVYL